MWKASGLEKDRAGAHITGMSQYADKAFVVLVHIPVENGPPRRESYVVGCPTREAAEARIKSLYPSEPNIKLFASPLSATEADGLKLMADEFRPWQ